MSLHNHQHSTISSSKPIILIIGSGWAGYRAALDIDKSIYKVKLVSPRNHFLFTPLLPSTAVGTLEFRAIQEPVRIIPNINYYQANVTMIDFQKQVVKCENAVVHDHSPFELKFDAMILASGCETNTFGIPGVLGNKCVYFLKQLSDARSIRNRLIDCFERASSPGTNADEIKRLITFVVVGGGPTNVEFAAELHDFLTADISRWYPDLFKQANIKIIEASGHILGQFKSNLVQYVEKLYAKRQIEILTSTRVKEVNGHVAELVDGGKISFGLMVWSTGVKQVPLIENISGELIAKLPNGRLATDAHLRLLGNQRIDDVSQVATLKPIHDGMIFAMGDCAAFTDKPLPALAQVAAQQGAYIANLLNKNGLKKISQIDDQPFKYQHLGSMASVGEWKGVYDSTNLSVEGVDISAPPLKGFLAFLLWRAAYWTNYVFGRDISRF